MVNAGVNCLFEVRHVDQLVLYPRRFERDLIVEFERPNAAELLSNRDDIDGARSDCPVKHLEDVR